jgi:hypothetical protein
MDRLNMDRRDFLKKTGAALGAVGAGQAQPRGRASIVLDPEDPLYAAPPVRWAAQELRSALAAHGMDGGQFDSIDVTADTDFFVRTAAAKTFEAEAIGITPTKIANRSGLSVTGGDVRGLVYGLLEIADRVRHSELISAVTSIKPIAEKPANTVRSISRMFVSDVEDKTWYNDREMWPAYLTMLATQRFNRFSLALGIGYDFLREVTDAYFLFAYPFFLAVPGYNVRAANLPDAERDRNLEMLKFISEQTVARGIEFQLGIWMHGYQWANSPAVKANYTIEGLTPENHANYCRDALTMLLKACPAISGVTFRIHGESGVAEGNYPFWKTIFDGVVRSGRKIEIDMHAKGIDQGMIDVGLATGMPVKVSPKFWAEHMGMPYHQADIRDQEIPRGNRNATGLMALSAGSRSFTRYGYADLLREDRKYGVLHRIWPGTQRLLLWGDPVTAAAYSRAFSFCGSSGVEIFEPLSFKGRRGSGIGGNRTAYADATLRPRHDWEKYLYSYRVWGRLLYNPQADPDTWHRAMKQPAAEAALASASRILPIITTAHGPSATNNTYWPEIYTNQPIVDPGRNNPYTDTKSPKVFGNVSPFDPQLFSRVNEFAAELIKGERSGKYSPVEVAQWLEDLADNAMRQLDQVKGAEQRRLAIDVSVEAGIGRFFGSKLRSGVLYGIHEQTGDRAALEEALKQYRQARDVWAQIAERTKGVYVADITVGEHPWLRGHWMDRLPAIDADISDMEKRLASAKAEPAARPAIAEALAHPRRTPATARHTPPSQFKPSQPLDLEIAVERKLASARLYYRHVNQAERYQSAEMKADANRYRAIIPAAYTDSPYPLVYYFELKEAPDKAWLYPGFNADLTNQPYFVITARS